MEWLRINSEKQLQRLAEFYNVIWESQDDSVFERFQRHASYDGFIGYMIEDERGIAGFGYGYRSAPGQFFNGLVERVLDADSYREWMSDCFEIAYLAVRSDMRRQGLGRMLVERLLEGTNAGTAVLGTQTDNRPARRLYERTGWNVIFEPYYPFGPEQPYVLYGKKLAASVERKS